MLPNSLTARIDAGDCWEWTGRIQDDGYGQMWWAGRSQTAHRVVYEVLAGPIPEGLSLDHLCRNQRCVNPDHLEPLPIRDNILRGYGPPAQASRRTACTRGHPFDFTRSDGYRGCRPCGAERQRRHRLRVTSTAEKAREAA